MINEILFFAATDTVWTRLGVCAVGAIVGVILILTGLQNIETQTAEESGKRRGVNNLLGKSNSYEGSKAVAIGRIRVACGIGAIIFGVVFLFVGPFLAE